MTIATLHNPTDNTIVNQTACKGPVTVMRRKISSLLLALLCLALAMVGVNDAQAGGCGTVVPPGVVFGTWTLQGSPYCVTGDITVGGLTIEAGVVVLVDGPYTIEIAAGMTAIGSSNAPIVFTEKNPDDNWKGLFFNNEGEGSILEHCHIENATNSGIRIVNSSPILQDCSVENNSSTGNGGGINASQSAGSILILESCNISNNTANPGLVAGSFRGGGVFVVGDSSIRNCTIRNNSCFSRCFTMFCNANSRGGGIYSNGSVTIENCKILGNLADCVTSCNGDSISEGSGGGVYSASGELVITNTIIACNTTTAACGGQNISRGSGIYVSAGSAHIGNCSIVENNNQGLWRNGGSVTVLNSIFFFNNNGGTQISGTTTATYSDIQGGFDGVGNINTNPFFASTECECPDFRILPPSNCVDAGNPAEEFNDGCFPPGLGSTTNDMGAHGGPLNCNRDCWIPADLNCDGSVSTTDLLILFANWGECPDMPAECVADLDCDDAVGTSDLLILLANWG